MNVLTTSEAKKLDHKTCEVKNITSLTLMKEAGAQLYQTFIKNCPLQANDKIALLVGVGNNGGDALVMASHLLHYQIDIILIGDQLSKESIQIYNELIQKNANIISFKENIDEVQNIITQADYIIDGIFGTGLDRSVDGLFFHAIELINISKAFVFSIDIPSGINGNNGLIEKIAVKANMTGIVQNFKLGNILNDAKDYHGTIKLIDIGIVQDDNIPKRILLTDEFIMPKRKHNTYKYHYGNVLTIGGNKGMTGAPLMCAYAALRTGSGLSSIFINHKYYKEVNNIHPEIMIKTYSTINSLMKMTNKFDVIAIGPGWGRNNKNNIKILKKLIELNIPLVIDADGLYYLKELFSDNIDLHNIIITPHVNEMATLLNTNIQNIISDPLNAITSLTKKHNLTVVLKGVCTIIANKDITYFANLGNPGMATAGSGDCLTGIIASLVGQNLPLIEAAKIAVIIHSLAGNAAKQNMSMYSMIATDIIEHLKDVL